MSWSEQIAAWADRAELLAKGEERHRVAATRALAANRPWEARQSSLRLLAEVPHSRVGLALWAESAERMLLSGEAVDALERLAAIAPFRADAWLRLAHARRASGASSREVKDALQKAAAATPLEFADAALFELAANDLASGDPQRAAQWLSRLGLASRGSQREIRLRLEVALDVGDAATIAELAPKLAEPDVLDGAGWLVQGRVLLQQGDPGALTPLIRSLILEAPRATAVLTQVVSELDDAVELGRIRDVVGTLGVASTPTWRAAFARAEGRWDVALAALAEAAVRADRNAIGPLAELAVRLRDREALRLAVAKANEVSVPLRPTLQRLGAALDSSDVTALDGLASADDADPAAEWALAHLEKTYRETIVSEDPSAIDWRRAADCVAQLALSLGAREVLKGAESLAIDWNRPLRLAIVGEFNAGKSSLVNALLGQSVAPVGVLPTTATLNRIAWAPDHFARVIPKSATQPERTVGHDQVASVLKEVGAAEVGEVHIFAPIEFLRRVELIDTPGFNAPDPTHTDAARSGLQSAHVAAWLVDATQPLKATEREAIAYAQELGVPLVVLANKVDRLGDAEAERVVLEHLTAALDEIGLTPLVAPVLFSARLALAADDDRSASRIEAVEQILDSIVADSRSHLDRALVRHALALLKLLEARAEARADLEVATRRVEITRREEAARGRAAIAAHGSDITEWIEARCRSELVAFRDQWSPAVGGSPDVDAQRFIRARARTDLAPRLLRAVLEHDGWIAVDEALADALNPCLRTLLASRSTDILSDPEAASPPLAALILEEVSGVLEQLSAAPIPPAAATGLGRCRSLVAVLRGAAD